MTEQIYKFDVKKGVPFKFDYDTGELCCVLCKDMYNSYNEPFITIIDTHSFIEVTDEFCLKCLYSFNNCFKCKRKIEDPYETIYFNILDKTYYCSCCYDNKRNKLFQNCSNPECISCPKKRFSIS